MSSFENFIGNGISDIVGNDMLVGLLLLAFFFGVTMIQGTRLDAKMVVLVPAVLLAAIWIQGLQLLLAIGAGIILYLAMKRMFNQ